MELLLPPIKYNNNGHPYVTWPGGNIISMDVTREVISNINCNALWTKPKSNDKWVNSIVKTTNKKLLVPNRVRGTYTGWYDTNRVIQEKCSKINVNDVLKWIYRYCDFNLYYPGDTHYEGRDIVTNRVEQIPGCPGCGRWLELAWVPWDNARYNGYNLWWICPNPNYSRECKTSMSKVWPDMCPDFIHRQVVTCRARKYTYTETIQTYFHNWEYDGNPIPKEYLRGPFTEWNIDIQDYLTKEIKMKDTKTKNVLLTPEQEECLRATYAAEGPAGLMKKYPHLKTSWYNIQYKAYTMGITRKIKQGR